jgi:type IV secretory pathway VirJ component
MKTIIAIALAALLIVPLVMFHRGGVVDTAEFGRVQLLPPVADAKGLAIVFGGVDEVDRAAARALAGAGFAVAAIDTAQAVHNLSKADSSRSCIDLLGPLEWLGSTAERDLDWNQYRPPLLLGRGVGGGLAYTALAQAPPRSFAGGMGVDVRPLPVLRLPFCRSAGASPGATWLVDSTTASGPDKAVSPLGRRGAAIVRSGSLAALYATAASRINEAAASAGGGSVDDLPLVEVSPRTTVDTLAVIYSGDGGWRDIDKQLGDLLAAHGLAVLGVDSLRYFWSERTPDQVSVDLARILTHYVSAWHVRDVVLIGYSFGADILPFAYARLPAGLQTEVRLVSLLAPTRAADFEIQPLGWFGAGPSDDARPIAPEAARIDRAKVQCIFGRDDATDSLCTDAAAWGMEVIRRPGGHHFDHDYSALAKAVLAGACRRGVACRA